MICTIPDCLSESYNFQLCPEHAKMLPLRFTLALHDLYHRIKSMPASHARRHLKFDYIQCSALARDLVTRADQLAKLLDRAWIQRSPADAISRAGSDPINKEVFHAGAHTEAGSEDQDRRGN